MANMKTEINAGVKELEGHVEKETSRLIEKQDAEKVELRAEVRAMCEKVEGSVNEQLKRSSNELQTLDYRLSNERKEAELRVKEDASGEPPSEVANNLHNPFVRMFNHLKEQIEHQKEKSLADCDKASEKLSLLEEDLKKRQEEERHLATLATELERERATREAALVVEKMEARVAEVQDDVKQR